jgi:hypothetical protein
MKKVLYPVTHKFVIATPPAIPPDGYIFELFNRHTIPDIPNTETCTTVISPQIYSWAGWQGISVFMTQRMDNMFWGWAFYPMSDMRFESLNIYTLPMAYKRWMPGSSFISVDHWSDIMERDITYVGGDVRLSEIMGRPSSDMWSGWHPNPPPMPTPPIGFVFQASENGIVYARDWPYPSHVC